VPVRGVPVQGAAVLETRAEDCQRCATDGVGPGYTRGARAAAGGNPEQVRPPLNLQNQEKTKKKKSPHLGCALPTASKSPYCPGPALYF